MKFVSAALRSSKGYLSHHDHVLRNLLPTRQCPGNGTEVPRFASGKAFNRFFATNQKAKAADSKNVRFLANFITEAGILFNRSKLRGTGIYCLAFVVGIGLGEISSGHRDAHANKFSELSLIQVAEYIASKQGSVDKASLDISHLDSSVDWRGTGVLPPVRNQGECGSCYALATCYAIECLLLLVMGLKVQLSPQELLDCDGQGGCCGGSFFQAFKYIIANGISLECDYPYCAEKLSCRADKSKKRYYITDYHRIPFRAYSEALLMEAVCKQPVVVSVAVGEDFDTYKTGVYDSYDRFQEVSHSMLLVGYGMFEGEKVWIVQNSYGEGWGYDGFGYIKRSNGTLAGSCGILVHTGYPIIKVERTNFENIASAFLRHYEQALRDGDVLTL